MLENVTQFAEQNQAILWAIGVASIVAFVASLFTMPAIIIRIPADYFQHDTRPPGRFVDAHPALRLVLRICKNVLGVVMLLAGTAMLVLPGQGLLTIFVGLLLLDIPRKYQFEQWLVRKRIVHRPINWYRKRHEREPLRVA